MHIYVTEDPMSAHRDLERWQKEIGLNMLDSTSFSGFRYVILSGYETKQLIMNGKQVTLRWEFAEWETFDAVHDTKA